MHCLWCHILLLWIAIQKAVAVQRKLAISDAYAAVGGVLCNLMAPNIDCRPQPCSRGRNFSNDQAVSNKIVVSYAHNGFGNQLWEHSFAWQVAESLGAQFYILPMKAQYCRAGHIPENSADGYQAMHHIFSSEFFLPNTTEMLDKDPSYPNYDRINAVNTLCDQEEYYFSDRIIDLKFNGTYVSLRNPGLRNIIMDKNPRCLKFVGYFEPGHAPKCINNLRQLWYPSVEKFYKKSKVHVTNIRIAGDYSENATTIAEPAMHETVIVNQTIEKEDVCVYLRCSPGHYFFNNVEYYSTILPKVLDPENTQMYDEGKGQRRSWVINTATEVCLSQVSV